LDKGKNTVKWRLVGALLKRVKTAAGSDAKTKKKPRKRQQKKRKKN
jgi:hypothetical protein